MSASSSSPWLALAVACAVGPLLTFSVNLFYYRKPPVLPGATKRRVSVLIPARDEEQSIEAAVESVLASTNVDLELLVLDDGSADRTAALVDAIHQRDPRVSVSPAPALPAGWNGKQHACAELGRLARFDDLCFLDADVRLAPEALEHLLAAMHEGGCDLVTGFPFEETATWLEQLLIPLIHFVLLSYLPLPGLRKLPRVPSLAAGCGQIMVVRREAYRVSGGHGAIRETMHDGILLPKLFREHGFATDLFDLTDLARCRMYRNAGEVWRGLGKNATEGMATPTRILPFTIMLFFGQVLPAAWCVTAAVTHAPLLWPCVAVLAGYVPRAIAMVRFRQSLFGAIFHPVGIAALLVLQWYSLARKMLGRQAVWKERVYNAG